MHKNITKFSNLIEEIYQDDFNNTNDLQHLDNTFDYFTSKSNEYIFYLTELDADIRIKKLRITKSLFSNKNKAKGLEENGTGTKGIYLETSKQY